MMNLLQRFGLGNKLPWPVVSSYRPQRLREEGSEYFYWAVPVTAAGAITTIALENTFPTSRRYLPLDWCEITNNEAAINLTVVVNGKFAQAMYVPTKVIRTITGKDTAIWQIGVRNDGLVATTLGLVIIIFKKLAATELVTREVGAEI